LSPEEFDNELNELEVRVERLRSLYEQYFLGIEKIPPGVAHKDVERRFWLIRKVKVRNTARRFKLQMLSQRFNTLQQHWTKICRQIENGTYVRHLVKAKRRAEQAISQQPPPPTPRPSYRVPRPDSFAPPKPKPGLDDARIDALHQQLAAAQAQLRPGERPVSRKAFAESLRVTEARLREKHADKQVDFQIVNRDGVVAIKPVLRKAP
jgi:type IV secretory pathway VirB10-like protein